MNDLRNEDSLTAQIKVWGNFACFTRPETLVERVSYEYPTPSASRGISDSVYRHPNVRWDVQSIAVLKPGRELVMTRNELKEKAGINDTVMYVNEQHTQRQTVYRYDVCYIITVRPRILPVWNYGAARKAVEQFKRRVKTGGCYHRPFLGRRECAAFFSEPGENDQAIDVSKDLGYMFFDFKYGKDENAGKDMPVFFNAKIERGVIHVPQDLYELVV